MLLWTGCSHARKYPSHWWIPVTDSQVPAWEILPQAAKPGEVILSKRNELGILSNFAPTRFMFKNKSYASVEGFWQMMLYPENPNPNEKWPFTRAEVSQMVGFEAKQAGERAEKIRLEKNITTVTFENETFPYRSQTQGRHYELIRAVMIEKLNQNPKVKEVLMSTGDLVLRPDHHGEPHAPPEWNYYEIWMELRQLIHANRLK
jgi:predicted NAD-dependent protein-ADP-ribosyltransferase YbiA (DUF1768 family)